MKHLEDQIEQDCSMRDELHMKQVYFLKNQVNELQVKLASTTKDRVFKNENPSNRYADQDIESERIPKIN